MGFDTSAAHCAAALLRGGAVIAERCEEMTKGQAERLMPMLEEMLAGAGVRWADLGVIGVGIGPGNFTGVRISVAAARGLALSLGIPAIGVSRLEALAEGGPRPVVVLEDARRGQAYRQHFAASAEPNTLSVSAPTSTALDIPTVSGTEPNAPPVLAPEPDTRPISGAGIRPVSEPEPDTRPVAEPDTSTPELVELDALPVTAPEIGSAARNGIAPALPLAVATALIAARRAGVPQPRPAPLYLRGADAAPPSDPPPVLLD
ncbi:tRNA (adenosine(37)-N6)-threonylcarbamoyltransferase complex dimerization subunit type 1 TsaB [Paenirhodobacter sp.]|uniref:tRNA (adenosine(37)-N6)-threonylcarbamoyltransferase complex dimerization subunit type 1 TsaB n=1 Tax=Paenirhodobacter sp. TaxID=1965326 RepID=UPI003B5019F6